MSIDYPHMGDQITMVIRFCDEALDSIRQESLGSGLDYMALRHALNNEGCSKSDIAEAFGISQSTLTRHLNRLVSAGFLTCAPDADDRRVFRCKGTAAGRAAIGRIEQQMEASIDRMMEAVPPSLVSFLDMGMVATAISLGCADCGEGGFNRISAYAESSLRFILKLTQITRSFDLPLSSYRILLLLEEDGPSVPEKEISSRLLMRKSTVSSALAPLLSKRLAATVRDPLDKRAKGISSTDKGARLVKKVSEPIKEHFIRGPKRSTGHEREMYGKVAQILVTDKAT